MDGFELAEEFSEFYHKHGDLEVLGFSVSDAYWEDGILKQWTTNTRLEYDPNQEGSKKVRLGNVGEEYVSIFNKHLINELPWFQREGEVVTLERAFEMVEKSPEKIVELQARAVAALMYYRNNEEFVTDSKKEYRDYLIFKLTAPEAELNFANVYAILVLHKAKFEMNPVVNKALTEISEGSLLINRIIKEKLSADLFYGGKHPELPEDLHDLFVFTGTNMVLGGGEAYWYVPVAKDPYAEIVRAATTANANQLWRPYDGVKKKTDPSLDNILSIEIMQEENLKLLYYPTKEKYEKFYEEFREEYLRFTNGQ